MIRVNALILSLLPVGALVAVAAHEAPDARTVFEREKKPLIPFDDYEVRESKIAPNQYLATILEEGGAEAQEIQQLIRLTRGVFDVRQIQAGRPYLTLFPRKGEGRMRFLVYEETDEDYIVFDLGEPIQVFRGKKQKQLREREYIGEIETSLYDAVVAGDLPISLTNDLADVFAQRVDFRKVRKGDRFKLIFEEEVVAGKVVGVGKIKAAWFCQGEKEYYSFAFDDKYEELYLDERGMGIRSGFLRAPVKGARVSSHYSRRRLHPVQKRYKAHLGTDYAAEKGTPVLAMADGVISEKARSRYNGNFVKIRHDDIHETQYLHMDRFAEGITTGTWLKRGQIIGYVGKTGLAAGPHVCLRFWKNGRQVDYRRQRFPKAREQKIAGQAEMTSLIQPLKVRLQLMGSELEDCPPMANEVLLLMAFFRPFG